MGIRLFFAGDVVLTKKREAELVTEELAKVIGDCDIACCNFEAPVWSEGLRIESKIGPSLHQDISSIDLLKRAGFNLFCMANNHIMDYGKGGLACTIESMKQRNVVAIGAALTQEDIYAPFIFEKSGIKIGVINIAENGFGSAGFSSSVGYAWYGSKLFEEKLCALIHSCNQVIVVCHGGAEKWSYPLPEYRELYRSWIDMGVCAVIAHHPHVPQGWEEYNQGVIFYSLGNFAFDKGLGIQDPQTIAVTLNMDGDSLDYTVHYTSFANNVIELCANSPVEQQLVEANNVMQTQEYMKKINQLCLEHFEKKYISYYQGVSNLYRGTFKQLLKTLYFRIVKRELFSETWLYHNLEIETHYWICRRALDLRRSK